MSSERGDFPRREGVGLWTERTCGSQPISGSRRGTDLRHVAPSWSRSKSTRLMPVTTPDRICRHTLQSLSSRDAKPRPLRQERSDLAHPEPPDIRFISPPVNRRNGQARNAERDADHSARTDRAEVTVSRPRPHVGVSSVKPGSPGSHRRPARELTDQRTFAEKHAGEIGARMEPHSFSTANGRNAP